MATRTLNGGLSYREYIAIHADAGAPPPWFRHTEASGKPTGPLFPDTLNTAEQAQVTDWLTYFNDANVTLTAAIAKVGEYKTYYASAAYLGWKDGNNLARTAQWKWYHADTLAANQAVTPPSQTSSGSGSGAPGGIVPACTQ